MFGVGLSELIIIFFLGFVFLGPKRLPALGKTLGEFLRRVQNVKEEVASSITNSKDS